MKKLLFLFLIGSLSHVWAQYTLDFVRFSDNEDIEIKSQNGKDVFVYFTAEWCGPCKRMQKDEFLQPSVIEASRMFTAIRIDDEHPQADSIQLLFGITAYPSFLILDGSDLGEKARERGAMSLNELLAFMETKKGIPQREVDRDFELAEKRHANLNRVEVQKGVSLGMNVIKGSTGSRASFSWNYQPKQWLLRQEIGYSSYEFQEIPRNAVIAPFSVGYTPINLNVSEVATYFRIVTGVTPRLAIDNFDNTFEIDLHYGFELGLGDSTRLGLFYLRNQSLGESTTFTRSSSAGIVFVL